VAVEGFVEGAVVVVARAHHRHLIMDTWTWRGSWRRFCSFCSSDE
jgi:hypothetical protein